MGTNDIYNRSTTSASDIAHHLLCTAKVLIRHHGVRHVILLEVLPRTTWGKYCGTPEFNDRVSQYNKALKAMCDACPEISFWSHGGIAGDVARYLKDGCHLNAMGMSKYAHSIRRAVLQTSKYFN